MRVDRVVACLLFALVAVSARAQERMDMSVPMGHMSMGAPLGLAEGREASGTGWLPDDTPVVGAMKHVGSWMLMAHGRAFVQEIGVSGNRGDQQFGSVNWIMGMAQKLVGGGQFTARMMLSAEPGTVGRCGYPDLLQSGESCRGASLHDRQHPHDLFMEVAARYAHPLGEHVAVDLYGGPAGEPALGPAAFPHRPSAWQQPIAPISHHWLDATHVSFGVVTGGLYGRKWKAEASAFNGREPDDARYGLDVERLDSWSARGSWMPSSGVVVQVSSGLLRDAEMEGDEQIDIRRTTASVTHHRVVDGRLWATTLAWGRNDEHGEPSHAVLAETAIDVSARDTFFARGEWVQKTSHDLDIEAAMDMMFGVTKIEAGYTRWLGATAGLRFGLGATAGVGVVPASLRSVYGSHPLEGALFLTVAPSEAR